MQGKIFPSPKKDEKTETTSNIKTLDFIRTQRASKVDIGPMFN